MFPSLTDSLILLEKYKYIIIFPLTIIEGPILMVIAGFLVYLGFFNVFVIYPLLVIADLIGDTFYYSLGRYGNQIKWVKRIEYFLGHNEKSEELLKKHFKKHTTKTLLIAKVAHGLGAVVQVTAGIARVNFLKYISIEFLGTIPKVLILLAIGFYAGSSYLKINTFLQTMAYTLIGLALITILFLIINKYSKGFLKTKHEDE